VNCRRLFYSTSGGQNLEKIPADFLAQKSGIDERVEEDERPNVAMEVDAFDVLEGSAARVLS
jgi:hypothetical protein